MSYTGVSKERSGTHRKWWHMIWPVAKRRKENVQAELIKPYKAAPYIPNGNTANVIFNVPLDQSLHRARVNICTMRHDGELITWGRVPAIVAKCGAYLKDHALDTPGIFRIPGSNKRMADLQKTFETPPKFGKNLDWSKSDYSVHDVASLLRRFLTKMPEPVIPIASYPAFRNVLDQFPDIVDATDSGHSTDAAAQVYRTLITHMPANHHYLLLYLLDLLAVFAKHAEASKMTASNLAVIFQPAIVSHPDDVMSVAAQKRNQAVLEFLIAHQSSFLLHTVDPPAETTLKRDSVFLNANTSPTTIGTTTPRSATQRFASPAHSPTPSLAQRKAMNRFSQTISPESRKPGKAEFIPSDSDEEAPPGGYVSVPRSSLQSSPKSAQFDRSMQNSISSLQDPTDPKRHIPIPKGGRRPMPGYI